MTPCRVDNVAVPAVLLMALSALCASSSARVEPPAAATPLTAPELTVPSIVGRWILVFDFNCDGGPGIGAWSVAPDGSYSDNAGNSGTWVQNGKLLQMSYSNRSHYDGRLKRKNLAVGRIFDADGGDIGCWKASR